MEKKFVSRLKDSIRKFEDHKISAAELSREVYNVAREIYDEEEAGLRRALEMKGNRVAVLAEQGLTTKVHPAVLDVVDEIQAELVEWGY